MSKSLKFGINFLEIFLITVLILLLMAVGFQKLSGNKDFFGYRIFTVATSSMVPNYRVGDTLLVKDVPINEIHVGDAVTYKGEAKQVKDMIITHRVESVEQGQGELLFHTKGIANNIEDPIVYEHQILGKVTYKFVVLSLFSKVAYNIYLLFIFITIPLAILITMEIVKLSKSMEEDEKTFAIPVINKKEVAVSNKQPCFMDVDECFLPEEDYQEEEEEKVQEEEKTVVVEKPVVKKPPQVQPKKKKPYKVQYSNRTKKYRNSSEYYRRMRKSNNYSRRNSNSNNNSK